jgi:ribosome-associated heat shock protein Hsp15
MSDRQRIDKWLWFARFAKTRTAAQKLVHSGAVRINRGKIDNVSHPIRVGDVITLASYPAVRVLSVEQLGERRGPAPEARLLYRDLAPPLETPPAARGGRPTKRDRRAIDAFLANDAGADEDFS